MSVFVRQLNGGEERLLVAARLVAVEHAPYLAHALFTVRPLASEGLGTCAVDRGWRLYLDPATLAGWGPALAGGVLVHEVSHLVRAHAERADALGADVDHDRWNVACFPPGTLLPNGVRIEDAATIQRPFRGELVGITSQAGSIDATPDHPFWTRRRRYGLGVQPRVLHDPEWIAAAELRIGDYVCVPRLAHKVSDPLIDLRPYVIPGTDRLGRATFANHAVKSIPLDANTAWLIGLYVAEGDATPNVRYSLGAHEVDLANRVDATVRALGWSSSRAVRGTSLIVNVGTRVFGRWLKEHCGPGAREKRIPAVIMRHVDPVIRRAFLSGLIDGDGHRRDPRGRRWCVLGTSSNALMRDVVLLLAQDGLGCYTKVEVQRPRSINGVALPQGVLYGVSWNPDGASATARLLNRKIVSSTSQRWRADADGVWYPIKRLTRRPFDGTVFNLTTPSHAYVANSYFVHNCDASINDDLLAARVPLPAGAVTPTGLGLEEGGIEEVYYAQLASRRGAGLAGTGAADDGCGSGAGAPAAPWELAADDPAAPGLGQADATIMRRRVAQAVREYAANRSRGTLPAGWQRWAEATLAGPQVPWRRVLASAVRRAIAHAAGCSDYTYRRPGRRRIPRIVTPALCRPLVTVAVVIDTSGSMGQAELDAALAEINGVVRAAGIGPLGLVVLACDAAVGAVTRVRRATDVRLVGGGGTDMRVGIAVAEATRPVPDVVVVLTDGCTPWPDRPTRARLVVAIIGDRAAAQHAPSWATTVLVPAA